MSSTSSWTRHENVWSPENVSVVFFLHVNIKRSPSGGNDSLLHFCILIQISSSVLVTEIHRFHRFLSRALKAAARLKCNRQDPGLGITVLYIIPCMLPSDAGVGWWGFGVLRVQEATNWTFRCDLMNQEDEAFTPDECRVHVEPFLHWSQSKSH